MNSKKRGFLSRLPRDGYSLDEAKARAERLADQHVPVILR
jgi:hypothetical protein